MRSLVFLASAALGLILAGCGRGEDGTAASAAAPAAAPVDTRVHFDTFTLPNGLRVVFHLDRSDPVVAVVLTAHVGSARELPGRTGFAHLFEHLLFLESENLGKGGLDAMSARIGGSGANGSTSRDRTNYLQTVPSDALEKMLWAEADKLGWFINTVTDPVLAKEKQVVKNEKRQSYDNQPYGHTSEVIGSALYPPGHPYHWEVIGSLDDIQGATLDDVKAFYRAWYTPNNVTLSVAGDFDAAEARAWVEKYFGEIPRGPDAVPQAPPPVELTATSSFFHEDRFAQLPELTLVWPGVPRTHPDFQALSVLSGLLAEGKEAPLNAVLVDEQKLTAEVGFSNEGSELAGELYLGVQGFEGIDLDAVAAAVEEGFARFEDGGIAERDLQRVKTTLELGYYDGIATVLGKAVALGEYAAVHGDADLLNAELAAIRAVTAADVMRVYDTYIRLRPHVATSFVPAGQPTLALTGASRAEVTEEAIVAGAEEAFDASQPATYERTPSSFDRSVEPPYGARPALTVPAVWQATAGNGLRLHGIVDGELPLVRFELAFDGGLLLEDPEAPGAANFLAEVLDKGTASRSPAEFEEELALLGAELEVSADTERFTIGGRTLARNFAPTLALVTDMLLQPRWDPAEIELARARIAADLQDSLASPTAIADRVYALAAFGRDHVLARDVRDTPASVAAMTPAQLRAYYGRLAPGAASFRLVGDVGQAEVEAALAALVGNWTTAAPPLPNVTPPAAPARSTVYFYDMPGSAQSVFRFGAPGPLRTAPDYEAVQVLNYRLGGGGFASRLVQELREGKGYTYGINSRFGASARQGGFLLASSVRSNVTLEAAQLARDILAGYGATFTGEDLDVSRSFLLKSQARAFESLDAKLGMLADIADYGLPADYVLRLGAAADSMTVERIRALAASWIQPERMHYVVVGDAATQAARLEELGYGPPVMVNAWLE